MAGTKGMKRPPRLLTDLRAVYAKPDAENGPPGQARLRTLYKENPKQFLDLISKQEAAFRGGQGEEAEEAPKGKPAAEVDEAHERVEELLDRLLAKASAGG